MSNAITEANSIGQVVDIINASEAEAEVMAGRYAWEAADESGYTDDCSIEAQLDFLVDAGAEFDFGAALENAISRKSCSA